MKSVGIVRRIDQLGRVVIAKELRKTLEIKEGNPLECFVEGDRIILRKYQSGCNFCGATDNLVNISGKLICRPCGADVLSALHIKS